MENQLARLTLGCWVLCLVLDVKGLAAMCAPQKDGCVLFVGQKGEYALHPRNN